MTEYSPQWKEKREPGLYAERDLEYFQGMYPQRIKELQKYVARQCDTLDYTNSPIYDEYPDREFLEQICKTICAKIPEEWTAGKTPDPDWTEEEQVEIYETRRPPWGPPPGGPPPGGPPPEGRPPGGPPPWGPPPGGRPPGGPPPWGPPPGGPPPGNPSPWNPPSENPSGNSWLSDIVKVLLMNELQRRRCHTGRC